MGYLFPHVALQVGIVKAPFGLTFFDMGLSYWMINFSLKRVIIDSYTPLPKAYKLGPTLLDLLLPGSSLFSFLKLFLKYFPHDLCTILFNNSPYPTRLFLSHTHTHTKKKSISLLSQLQQQRALYCIFSFSFFSIHLSN